MESPIVSADLYFQCCVPAADTGTPRLELQCPDRTRKVVLLPLRRPKGHQGYRVRRRAGLEMSLTLDAVFCVQDSGGNPCAIARPPTRTHLRTGILIREES
jgi:hypothetical protein